MRYECTGFSLILAMSLVFGTHSNLFAQDLNERTALVIEVQVLTKVMKRHPNDESLYRMRANAFSKLGLQKLEKLDRLKVRQLGGSLVNSIGMKLERIPAGEFMMGSSKSASGIARQFRRIVKYYTDEHPQHRVRITNSFYLAASEVTQGQWKTVMGTEPWKGTRNVREGSDYAANYVSWEDAVEFCRRLSEKDGRSYRLPTEAEWEYACRAGTKTMFGFGESPALLKDFAWFEENTYDVDEEYAHRVERKRPNAFGLYDMHGNVYEWCSDWYDSEYYSGSPAENPTGSATGSYRVFRGGDWLHKPHRARSANRRWFLPTHRDFLLGFRVASSIEPSRSAR